MHAALRGSAGELAGRVVAVMVGGLAAFSLHAGGGSSYGPLVGIGGLAILAAAAGIALIYAGVLPRPPLERPGLACLGFLAGLVLWTGLSILWSVVPDRSWEYFNRGVAYLAFIALGVLLAATLPGAVRLVALGLTALIATVIVWALAGKVFPPLFPDGERIARLRDPIGYWNGLALLAAMVYPLGLSLVLRREHPRLLRAAANLLVFAATVALLLTYSRGGVVVALVVIAVLLAVSTQRFEAVVALAVAGVPAVAVGAWAFTQPGIASDFQSADVREADGLQLGLALLVAGAVVAWATAYLLEHEERWRPRFRWKLSGARLAAGGGVALVAVVLIASRGHPIDWARDGFREFTNPVSQAGTNPERLRQLNLNSRWTWWEESWSLFTEDPVGGAGAGSFAVARRPIRANTTFATEPHNVLLQFLSETGVVGFALFVGFVASATAAVVRTVDRAKESDAVFASALALALLAYLLHALIDYDWDFVALTAPVMVVLGVLLLGGGAPRRHPPAPLWAIGAILVAAVSVFSLAAPWLAGRSVDSAYAALERNDLRSAEAAADRAHLLDPLAIEPLFALAATREAEGSERGALEYYVEAVELQPLNFRTWYELGRFELATGRRERAIRHLQRARGLDPLGPANDLLLQLGL